ncbi:interferon-inducible GTPase 5-like [Paramuricea clavata]|uniref:Interferon-inducible GTPase 5-like n=1 Tax=Paramuricea clavata TaxID=317549 RepID=A0A7D9IY65_PARCT|nr:interferon-inducible GTPase 5-like [Paramuricea clavata]
MADARIYIKQNGVSNIKEFLEKKLEGSKDVKIRFAITGNGGTGKSAFINAIRGLRDDDGGAAEVGVTETTTKPTEYQHPDNPMISFLDLPGIGTPNFPDLRTYCEKVSFEDYDTFLIFTKGRFTKNDLDLAKKVKSIGKSFFLVRAHIDEDCNRRSTNESEILKEIRENCVKNVKALISSEDEIFLISNYHKDKWDFDRLIAAISDALPVRQRESLTLSLSNVTRECLKRKAKILRVQAVAVATISAGAGAIPIPCVGGVIGTILITGTMMVYYRQLGLNNTTAEERALLDEKYRGIIERYQSRSPNDVVSILSTKALTVIVGVEEVSKYIPLIGLAIASSIGFALTLRYLLKCINELEEAAIAVWDNAAKRSIQDGSDTSTKNSSAQ